MISHSTFVIHPASAIPEHWRWVALVNPITPIVETFRAAFLGSGSISWGMLGYSLGAMLLVFFLGTLIFNQVEQTFMDTI